MALRNQPYFPFYIQDYMTDEKLLMCTWATQGIYIRIMCCLHKQRVYGAFLLVDLLPTSLNKNEVDAQILFKQNPKQNLSIDLSLAQKFAKNVAPVLCKLIACQISEMANAIEELLRFGVMHIDTEKLYQKRMYQDGITSDKRSKAAKIGGGNPCLSPTSLNKNEVDAQILFKQNPKQNTEYEYEYEYENESSNNKEQILNFDFDSIWNLYDKKVGYKTKLINKWHALTNTERAAIMQYIPKYKQAVPDKRYRKNLETFLNNRSWEDELINTNTNGTATATAKGGHGTIPSTLAKDGFTSTL